MGLFKSIGNAFGFGGGSGGGVTGDTWASIDQNIQTLKDRAAGKYDSLAQAQLKQAQADQREQLAGGVRGIRAINPAEQARLLAKANTQMASDAAGQAAVLRAQEDARSQEMLTNAITGKANLQTGNYAQALADKQNRQAQRQQFFENVGKIGSMAATGGQSAAMDPQAKKTLTLFGADGMGA